MMQQTEKYKLNLIEKTDTFSPDPLNENMEKVEAAITAEADALDQRLQVFEAKHFAMGTYYPDKNIDIDLGFSPSFVFIHGLGTGDICGVLIPEYNHPDGKITSNGFHINTAGTSSNIGYPFCRYVYIAFD